MAINAYTIKFNKLNNSKESLNIEKEKKKEKRLGYIY